MNIEHPRYLLLLGVALLFLGVMIRSYTRSRKALTSLTGADTGYKGNRFFRRFVLMEGTFLLMIVCILFGAAGFTWGRKAVEDDRMGVDIVFVLDISRSMLARDIQPSRLGFSVDLASSLVSAFPEARFGIVVFKGSAVRAIPLTEDRWTVEKFLREVSPESLGSKGSNLNEGLEQGLASFPNSMGRKGYVILLSDGESQAPISRTILSKYREEGIPVFCVGVGTPQGSLIGDPDPIRGKDGKPVVSRLKESVLQEVAQATQGIYQWGDTPGIDRILWERLTEHARDRNSKKIRYIPAERYGVFLGIALLLLIIHLGARSLPWKDLS